MATLSMQCMHVFGGDGLDSSLGQANESLPDHMTGNDASRQAAKHGPSLYPPAVPQWFAADTPVPQVLGSGEAGAPLRQPAVFVTSARRGGVEKRPGAWHVAVGGRGPHPLLHNALHGRTAPLLPKAGGSGGTQGPRAHSNMPQHVTAMAVAPTHKVLATAVVADGAPLSSQAREGGAEGSPAAVPSPTLLVTHVSSGACTRILVDLPGGVSQRITLLAFSGDGSLLAGYAPPPPSHTAAPTPSAGTRGQQSPTHTGTESASAVSHAGPKQDAAPPTAGAGDAAPGWLGVWRWSTGALLAAAPVARALRQLSFRPDPLPGSVRGAGAARAAQAGCVLLGCGQGFLRLWHLSGEGGGTLQEHPMLAKRPRERELFVDHAWLTPPPGSAKGGSKSTDLGMAPPTPSSAPGTAFLPGSRCAVALERGVVYILTASTSKRAAAGTTQGSRGFGTSLGGQGSAGGGSGGVAALQSAAAAPGPSSLGGSDTVDGLHLATVAAHGLPLEYEVWQELYCPIPPPMRGLPGYTWSHVTAPLKAIASGTLSARLAAADTVLQGLAAGGRAASAAASAAVLVDTAGNGATMGGGGWGKPAAPRRFEKSSDALAAAAASTARDVLPSLACVTATQWGFVVGGEGGYTASFVMPHLLTTATTAGHSMDIPVVAATEAAAARLRAADKAAAADSGMHGLDVGGAGGDGFLPRPRVLYSFGTAVRAGLGSGYGDGSFLVGDVSGGGQGGGGGGGSGGVAAVLAEEAAPDVHGRITQPDTRITSASTWLTQHSQDASALPSAPKDSASAALPTVGEAPLLGGCGVGHGRWAPLVGHGTRHHLHRTRVGKWCPAEGTSAFSPQADFITSVAAPPPAFLAAVRHMWAEHMSSLSTAGGGGQGDISNAGAALGALEFVPVSEAGVGDEEADTVFVGGGGAGGVAGAIRDSSWVAPLCRAVWAGGPPRPGDALVVTTSPAGGTRVVHLALNRQTSSRLQHQHARDASVPLSLRGQHGGIITDVSMATWRSAAATLCPAERTVRLWNLKTWACDAVHVTVDEPVCMSLHPSGHLLALGFHSHLSIVHVLAHSLRPWRDVTAAKHVRRVAFSHAGAYLAAACQNAIAVFDTLTMVPLWRLAGQPAPVLSLAWSRSDTALAAGAADGTVMTWHLPPWGEAAQPPSTLTGGSGLEAASGRSTSSSGLGLPHTEDEHSLRSRSSSLSHRLIRPAARTGRGRRGSVDSSAHTVSAVQAGGGAVRSLGAGPHSALSFPRGLIAARSAMGIDPAALGNVWGFAQLASLAASAGLPFRPVSVKRVEATSVSMRTGHISAVALNHDGTIVAAAAHSRRVVLAALAGGDGDDGKATTASGASGTSAAAAAQKRISGTTRLINYSSVLAVAGHSFSARMRLLASGHTHPDHGPRSTHAEQTRPGSQAGSSAVSGTGSASRHAGVSAASLDLESAQVRGVVITCMVLNTTNTVLYAGLSSGHIRAYAWPLQVDLTDTWQRPSAAAAAGGGDQRPSPSPTGDEHGPSLLNIGGALVPAAAAGALVDADLLAGSYGTAPFQDLHVANCPITSLCLGQHDSTLVAGTAKGALVVVGIPMPTPDAIKAAAQFVGLAPAPPGGKPAISGNAVTASMLAGVRRLASTARLASDAQAATPTYLLSLLRAAALNGPCVWPSPACDPLVDTSPFALVHRTAISSAYRTLASAQSEQDELRARLEGALRTRERELQHRIKSLQESSDQRAAKERKRHDDLLVTHERYVRAQVRAQEEVHAAAAAMVQASENQYEEKLALERERFDRLSGAALAAASKHEEEVAAYAAAAEAEQDELRKQLGAVKEHHQSASRAWQSEKQSLVQRFEELLRSTSEDHDLQLDKLQAQYTAESKDTAVALTERTKEVIALKRYVRDFRKAAQAAQTMLQNKEDALSTLEAKVEQLRRGLSVKDAKIASLRAELGSKESTLTTLKGDVRVLSGFKYVLESQVQSLAEAEAPLRHTVSSLRGTLTSVQEELRHHHAHKLDTAFQRSTEKSRLATLEAELARTKASLSHAKVEKQSILRDIQVAVEAGSTMGASDHVKGGLDKSLAVALVHLHDKHVLRHGKGKDILAAIRDSGKSAQTVVDSLKEWSEESGLGRKAAPQPHTTQGTVRKAKSAASLAPVRGIASSALMPSTTAAAARGGGKASTAAVLATSLSTGTLDTRKAADATRQRTQQPDSGSPAGFRSPASPTRPSEAQLKTVEEVLRQRDYLQRGLSATRQFVSTNLAMMQQQSTRTLGENTSLIQECNNLRRRVQEQKHEITRLVALLQRNGIRRPRPGSVGVDKLVPLSRTSGAAAKGGQATQGSQAPASAQRRLSFAEEGHSGPAPSSAGTRDKSTLRQKLSLDSAALHRRSSSPGSAKHLGAHHVPEPLTSPAAAHAAAMAALADGGQLHNPNSKYRLSRDRSATAEGGQSPETARSRSVTGLSRPDLSNPGASLPPARLPGVRVDTLGSSHPLAAAHDAAHEVLFDAGALSHLPVSPANRRGSGKERPRLGVDSQ